MFSPCERCSGGWCGPPRSPPPRASQTVPPGGRLRGVWSSWRQSRCPCSPSSRGRCETPPGPTPPAPSPPPDPPDTDEIHITRDTTVLRHISVGNFNQASQTLPQQQRRLPWWSPPRLVRWRWQSWCTLAATCWLTCYQLLLSQCLHTEAQLLSTPHSTGMYIDPLHWLPDLVVIIDR